MIPKKGDMMSVDKLDLLLLDDDDIRMDFVVTFLEETHFKVFRAHHPSAAWDLLKRIDLDFKIIILDLIIPPKECYDVLICPNVEDCGKVFLQDLRDDDFENSAISKQEHENRRNAKERYRGIPVAVLTARNPTREGLASRLKEPPLNASRIDRKMPSDLEEYVVKLAKLADLENKP
jgi:CheY-like chemotaxis protein